MLRSEQTIEDIKKALLDPDFGNEKRHDSVLKKFFATVTLIGILVASTVIICLLLL
jgi:hypothetical protein